MEQRADAAGRRSCACIAGSAGAGAHAAGASESRAPGMARARSQQGAGMVRDTQGQGRHIADCEGGSDVQRSAGHAAGEMHEPNRLRCR